jgi:hypothetical protein
MVSPDDQTTLAQLKANQYVNVAAFVILYYDHALTLSMEIQRFWTRGPFTWATFFFFVNRYLAFLGYFPVVLWVFWDPSDLPYKFIICRHMLSYHQYIEVASQLVVGVLLIMRVYAMYDRKRWVVWLFIIGSAAGIVVGCWSIASKATIAIPSILFSSPGCIELLGTEQADHLAVTWSGQLAFDALVFFLILRKSFTFGRTGHRILINTLHRDGALYFTIMTVANLANILAFLLAAPISKGVGSASVNIISVTMMSRLMLNLRDPKMLISTQATTTASSNLMISTFLDGRLSLTNADEEFKAVKSSPIEDIEMVSRTQNLDLET